MRIVQPVWPFVSRRKTSKDTGADLEMMNMTQGDWYLLPRDSDEIHRLDFQHFLLRQALQGNYQAPIGSAPRTILDMGSGTGRWTADLAQAFPNAHVVGVDLKPTLISVPFPGNMQFQQANIFDGLPFPDQSFDFVHQRLLVAGIPTKQWPHVIGELVRVMSVGGWIELVEGGTTYVNAGPATAQFLQWAVQFSLSRGIDIAAVKNLGSLLEQQRLKQLHAQKIDLPLGAWAGRVGAMMEQDMLAVFKSMKEQYCSHLQVAPTIVDQVIRALSPEWATYQTRYRFYLFYGQR